MHRKFAARCVSMLAASVALIIGLGFGGATERADAAETGSPKAGEEAPDFAPSSSAAAVLDRIRHHTFHHPVEDGFTKDAALDHPGIADLDNDDWRVRTLAIRDLARIGAPAVPALVEGLQDDDLHVPHVSALALRIFPTDEEFAETLPARRRALRKRLESDPNPIVRSEAAIALGRIGAPDNLLGTADHRCAIAVTINRRRVNDPADSRPSPDVALAGDEVQLIFDGAGVKWIGKLADSEHEYHKHYQAVQDKTAGVCKYCAGAFQVTEQIERAGVPFADEFNGHPSFRNLVNQGFQVITF